MSLRIKLYSNRPCYCIRGTVKVGTKSSGPIFESTGVRVDEPRAKQRAEEICFKREAEIRDALLNGPRQADVSWNAAALHYCEWRKMKREAENPDLKGTTDPEAGFVLRLTEYLESVGAADLPLSQITLGHIEGYLLEHLKGSEASYMHRCKNNFTAVMNHAKRNGLCRSDLAVPKPTLPKFNARQPVNKHFSDEAVALFVEHAPPHAQLFFAALFTLGLRGGELLHAKRTPMQRAMPGQSGICLVPGKECLYLAKTKTGMPLERVIPPELAEAFRQALAKRTDKFDALFLTDKKRPYARPKSGGAFRFRAAWHSTQDRVAEELTRRAEEARKAGDVKRAEECLAEAETVRQSTGHWGRHTMISNAVMAGVPDRVIMEMSGHLGREMIDRYTHLRDESVRNAAALVSPTLKADQMLPPPGKKRQRRD